MFLLGSFTKQSYTNCDLILEKSTEIAVQAIFKSFIFVKVFIIKASLVFVLVVFWGLSQ